MTLALYSPQCSAIDLVSVVAKLHPRTLPLEPSNFALQGLHRRRWTDRPNLLSPLLAMLCLSGTSQSLLCSESLPGSKVCSAHLSSSGVVERGGATSVARRKEEQGDPMFSCAARQSSCVQ